MLNAEYSNISRSGASINTLHASYDRIDWYTPGSLWGFSNFQPHAVVINIGANDVGRPKKKIKKDYHALLDDMRASYPDAHIMLYNAWGWDYNEPANYIHEVIAERVDDGETNMSFAIFPWLFEQWHGCEYDHSGMAQLLADHLVSVLGSEGDDWTPSAADVMTGYGINGNVANGGFEEIAPFGGYGWRYYTDTDVSRELGGAFEGEYYLQLSNGAAVHQPNPVMEGETFAVTVWMRGAYGGEKVDTTMDFRDQKMWTDPLESTTRTHTLTNGWQKFDMCATAPTGTANPVFHTRLTFQAGAGSKVDIDNVYMILTEEECDDPGSESCGQHGDSCISGGDCCSGSCSKGKPSGRVCLP